MLFTSFTSDGGSGAAATYTITAGVFTKLTPPAVLILTYGGTGAAASFTYSVCIATTATIDDLAGSSYKNLNKNLVSFKAPNWQRAKACFVLGMRQGSHPGTQAPKRVP